MPGYYVHLLLKPLGQQMDKLTKAFVVAGWKTIMDMTNRRGWQYAGYCQKYMTRIL